MKTFRIALLLFTVVLGACSKDETPEPDALVELWGEWKLEEYRYNGSTTVSHGELRDVSTYSGQAEPIDAVLTINEDESWDAQGSYNIAVVTTAEGETQRDEGEADFIGAGIYTMDGDQLVFDYTGDIKGGLGRANEFTVQKLTENELVLFFEETRTASEEGVEVVSEIEVYQRYSR